MLIPFSLIFYLIIKIRSNLYDKGYLKIKKLPLPVISIGNISTGGTGKTPFTILTAKLLLSKGMTVGIVSRGYKRKSSGTMLVSDGYITNKNFELTGDELSMTAEELLKDYKGKFSVAAGEDRNEAAKYLYEKFQPDIFILDDGFQHRSLKRDLDIVLVDAEDYKKNNLLNKILIPAGNLREGYSNLKRADIIIQNNKTSETGLLEEAAASGKPHSVIRYGYEYFVDHQNIIFENVAGNLVIFSGIARSYSFRKILTGKGYNVIKEFNFEDHHYYSEEDIKEILSSYKNGMAIVTTQKDFLKLENFKEFLTEYPVYYLKLKIVFESGEDIFLSKINELIELKKNRNNKIRQ